MSFGFLVVLCWLAAQGTCIYIVWITKDRQYTCKLPAARSRLLLTKEGCLAQHTGLPGVPKA